MRWVPAGSFDRLSDPAALWRAYLRVREGRRRRADLARFDLDADRHVLSLARALRDGVWRPSPVRQRLVHDPKPRHIVISSITDRVVHRALIDEIAPTFERGFIDQSFAAAQGRGPARAALYALRQLRDHRFALALDIRAYFASVQRDVLLGLYARRVKDARTLELLASILGGSGLGLALGSYVSHFSGALYMDGLDHHVKRELKIPGYLRYMDDLALFHDDPRALEVAHRHIEAWLREERGLALKPSTVQPCARGLTLLGYRVTRAGLAPSAKVLRRVRGRVQAAAQRGPEALSRTLASYRGLVLT